MDKPIFQALEYQLCIANKDLGSLKDIKNVNRSLFMALEFPLSPVADFEEVKNIKGVKEYIRAIKNSAYPQIIKKIDTIRQNQKKEADNIYWYIDDEKNQLSGALHMSLFCIAKMDNSEKPNVNEIKKCLDPLKDKIIKSLQDILIKEEQLQIQLSFIGKSKDSLTVQCFYKNRSFDKLFKNLSKAIEKIRDEFPSCKIVWNPWRINVENSTQYQITRNKINIGRYKTKDIVRVKQIFRRQEDLLEKTLREGCLIKESFIVPGIFLCYSDQLFFNRILDGREYRGQEIIYYFPFKAK